MKPETRRILGWIVAIVPITFLLSCINVIKFMAAASGRLIQEKQIASIPAPTRLLLANAGLASMVPLGLAITFGIVLWGVGRRFKDDADRQSLELLAHTAVWFLAIFYYGAVSMAAFLPWAIAINR